MAQVTLTEFLLARIAEDEVATSGLVDDYDSFVGALSSDAVTRLALGPFLARFDPTRVLAECKAKRLVIEAAWADHCRIENEWGTSQSRDWMSANNDNPEVISALAAIDADHPDYREEWALTVRA